MAQPGPPPLAANFARLLVIAAVILFAIGALLAFGVFGSASVADLLGLTLAGLACWATAALG